jgi:ATP-dependent Clp protease protease subunit
VFYKVFKFIKGTIMRTDSEEFRLFATKKLGISSLALHQFQSINAANYISPTIIEERQLNVAQMDVFSRLMMDRIIFLGIPIDDYVANIIQAQLLFLESSDPGKDIQIYFNSPGGSVHAGLGIYDTMQYINCDIATICTGMAASMAAVLMTAGTKGKRSALTHSRIMIHQPMGGAQGAASDIQIVAKEIAKLQKELYQIIANHSGQPIEKVEQDSDRDYWMTSQEALDYGMIDDILIRIKKQKP